MPATSFHPITESEDNKSTPNKWRAVYLRPFVLFWLGSFVFEAAMFLVSIAVFSGFRGLFQKFMWTIIFCPLGMGGAMGGMINYFITDQYYGKKAVLLVAILSILVLGTCNDLCYNLDLIFGWFGATDHFWWWHARYPFIFATGYMNGKLLFTDEGQQALTQWGL
ncbi:hypothetical protein F5Y13DRAFT_163924 [Hypoxylon sp. FL1857]|nr:hypothetical protein F5Y13DRAFT_163924 [Hypoxylon sp. FL1857]